MKKALTWIALCAAFCAACSDDDDKCNVNDAAYCVEGEIPGTTALVMCVGGELKTVNCGVGSWCNASTKTCDVECKKETTTPTCEEYTDPTDNVNKSRVKYCSSNNEFAYTDCGVNGCWAPSETSAGYAHCKTCVTGEQRCGVYGDEEICNAQGLWESCTLAANKDKCTLDCSQPTVSPCNDGAERCGSDGEREKCVGGAWVDDPCCDDPGSLSCAHKCSAGTCVATCKEGDARCLTNGDQGFQVCVKNASGKLEWTIDATQNLGGYCSGDKPYCSDGACVSSLPKDATTMEYCGDEDITYSGKSMKLQEACDQLGTGLIGVCIGSDVTCVEACTTHGQTQQICDTYNTTSGGKADFELNQRCSSLGEGRLVWEDLKQHVCKNACNTSKDACDSQGYADGGGSSGGGSTTEPSWYYCGSVQLSDGSTIDENCEGYVGVCDRNDEEYYYCFETCSASSVGSSKAECVVNDGKSFALSSVCTALDSTHTAYIQEDSSVKQCANACNTSKDDCDSQGYVSGGSTGGDTSSYEYCGNEQATVGGEKVVIDNYCQQRFGANYIGVCEGNSASCIESCTTVGSTSKVCEAFPVDDNGTTIIAAASYTCTNVGSGKNALIITDAAKCKNACNSDKTDCDSQGYTQQ